jgi:hypothetical protein
MSRQKKKKRSLSPEIKRLTCKELEHFTSADCNGCEICAKVWKAYGHKVPITFRETGTDKKAIPKNTKTLLLR